MARSSGRKPLIAGNWKMNLTHLEAIALVQKIAFGLREGEAEQVEIAVLPPFTSIRSVQSLIEGDRLPLVFGGQDVSKHSSGAYTGEIAGGMLAKLGCSYVVVGHSEIVGKPIAFLLMSEGATVTVCHHMTRSVRQTLLLEARLAKDDRAMAREAETQARAEAKVAAQTLHARRRAKARATMSQILAERCESQEELDELCNELDFRLDQFIFAHDFEAEGFDALIDGLCRSLGRRLARVDERRIPGRIPPHHGRRTVRSCQRSRSRDPARFVRHVGQGYLRSAVR